MSERNSEQEAITRFIKVPLNLVVELGKNDHHYVESMEQASNGKLVIHTQERDLCLLDIDAPIWINRSL